MISSADPVGLGAWGRVRGGTTCNRTQQILRNKESAACRRFRLGSVLSTVPHEPLSGGKSHPHSRRPSRVGTGAFSPMPPAHVDSITTFEGDTDSKCNSYMKFSIALVTTNTFRTILEYCVPDILARADGWSGLQTALGEGFRPSLVVWVWGQHEPSTFTGSSSLLMSSAVFSTSSGCGK